jgi:hypothetical protein
LLFSFTVFGCAAAFGQATVNEDLETVFRYVDGASGSDANPGTKAEPLRTIGAAVAIAEANNQQGLGTRVVIKPGIYRESLTVASTKNQTSMPMTFEAASSGTVFVSGAAQLTGWVVSQGNANVFTAPWAYQWGLCEVDGGRAPLEQDIVRRREMFFVNGAPMTQVLSRGELIFPGMFYVDEAAGQVYLRPPAGTDMAAADIEAAVQPKLLGISAPSSTNLNGVVFRGITFMYANSCRKNAAVIVAGGTNILFDHDKFIWNNAQGLGFSQPAANITVQHTIANHNGSIGFQTFQLKNGLWSNIEASYNNWRGAQGAYYQWNSAGAHMFSDHGDIISGFKAIYNQTFSLHWDTDVENVTATNILSSRNLSGMYDEKSIGPISISNARLCYSKPMFYAHGFELRNAENISLTDSVIYDGQDSQIIVTGIEGGILVTNWETGKTSNLINRNFTFTGNTVSGFSGQTLFKDSIGGKDWTSFISTLNSDNNTWWNPAGSKQFIIAVPDQGTTVDLNGWQNNTGRDLHSVFESPTTNPASQCAVNADAPDFWLVSDTGQATADLSGNAVYNLTTVSLGGLTGTVSLATAGVSRIPGAKATLAPNSVSTSGSSVLTISTAAGTPGGTYTFTALAHIGGITRTSVLSLVVPQNSVRFSPGSLNFPNQPVGTTSPPQTITMMNVSAAPISIYSMTPTVDLAQSNNCGKSLAAGASCAIQITFHPQGMYYHNGSITISDSVGGGSQVLKITGSVVGSSKAAVSPGALFFGNNVYGNPSKALTAILLNTGTAPLNVTSIAISGANPSDFSQTNTCPATLAVGASCVINATFTPAAMGPRTASLSISDDALNSPQTVSLNGTGRTSVQVNPVGLYFGAVKVGKSGAPLPVTVTNLSSAALAFSAPTFTGADAGDFTQSNNCGSSLAGGASCVIQVTFAPGAKGTRTGGMQIRDSDPTSPQSVSLHGGGN